MSRFSFPHYPNGWFQMAWSDEIAVGDVRRLSGFGKELVAYRGKSGLLCVLDAYCPHLGAHLGVGGTVEGDTIQCPFHGWRFDGNSACVDVPYAKCIPANSGLTSWPVVARNGHVMVWHPPLGALRQWEIPALDEYQHDDWPSTACAGRFARTTRLAENAVDRAHFRSVQGALDLPESRVEIDGPVLHVRQTAKMATPRGPVEGQLASQSYGFGFVATRFTGSVETLLIASVLPIDENDVDVRFSFTLKKIGDADVTRAVGRALVADIEKQMNENKPIWENKRHLPRPLLCDGDGPIAQFRRWSEQFYSWPKDHAPSVAAR